jgi:predicted ATP-grasp superfamily ATP-dependent carboligase
VNGHGGPDAALIGDTSVPIVVLRRQFVGLQRGALGVARSAGRLGIAVYGVYERWEPAARSRFNRGRLRLPPDASDEQVLHALGAFGRRRGRAVLVPTDDKSAIFVGDHADALREHFLFPDMPPELYRRLSSKKELSEVCRSLAIPTPELSVPSCDDDVREFAERFGYPVVLKQVAGWEGVANGSAPGVVIARDRHELLAAYRQTTSPDGVPNVLLQEYIPGGSESIWMFNGYFDARSECLVGFTGQKVRQCGPHTGPTTLGVCRWNADVAETTTRLAKSVGYRGIMDIGYRYDGRDGLYKLLDLNPRLGSTFRLFVGVNGLDVLRALYLDLTGQPVPATTARDGRRWIDEPHDLVSAIQIAREGTLGAGGCCGRSGELPKAPGSPVTILRRSSHCSPGSPHTRSTSSLHHAELPPQRPAPDRRRLLCR